ncbi:MAG: pentapeptide repeat-containing protein [Actinobacteria bacterium]|nr:pentapeptide repeat-containing protein [Actinomycetota bacterium]
MKLAKIQAIALLVAVAGCGTQSASQYATETSNVPEVTESSIVEVTDVPSVKEETTTTTTTTLPPTTTTTLPPTTTTVLDTLCIKFTQCQYANLVGVDFSRLQLDFQNFSVATLTGASFAGANLAKSLFIRADLTNVNFVGANLSGVDFTAAVMTGANLEGANLTDAIFCDVDLKSFTGTTTSQLAKVKKFKTKGKTYCP